MGLVLFHFIFILFFFVEVCNILFGSNKILIIRERCYTIFGGWNKFKILRV